MTVLVNRSAPGQAHIPLTRRTAVAVMVALAATASLVVLDQMPLTPAWLNWSATAVALATVLTMLMTALAGWQRIVTSAVAEGVVAATADQDGRRTD